VKRSPTDELTLQFIGGHIERHGYPPSRRDIGRHFSITRHAAECRLARLITQRLVAVVPKVSRGIQLTDDGRVLLSTLSPAIPS
jgi:Mn-dependent DtxR family transcriptional regulator